MFGIVERTVEEEVEFRNYAQLGGHLAAELPAYRALVLLEYFQDGNMLTKALAMLRSGLTRTSLTVTRLPANMAMPFPRIISARSR